MTALHPEFGLHGGEKIGLLSRTIGRAVLYFSNEQRERRFDRYLERREQWASDVLRDQQLEDVGHHFSGPFRTDI